MARRVDAPCAYRAGEMLRLHYAKTLRRWLERLAANWARVEEIYDARDRAS